jgi:hypothetical protein
MADDRPPGMVQKDCLRSWVLILQIDAANNSRRGAQRRIAMIDGVLAALQSHAGILRTSADLDSQAPLH